MGIIGSIYIYNNNIWGGAGATVANQASGTTVAIYGIGLALQSSGPGGSHNKAMASIHFNIFIIRIIIIIIYKTHMMHYMNGRDGMLKSTNNTFFRHAKTG